MGGSIPDGGLARPIKITLKPKTTVIRSPPLTTQKQQKCQPAVRDTPVIGTHPIPLGGSIPDGGLARQIKITIKLKTAVIRSQPLKSKLIVWEKLTVLWLWLWLLAGLITGANQWEVSKQCHDITNRLSTQQEFSLDGRLKFWNHYLLYISSKNRNREQRAYNGNISDRIKIVQWNLGSRLWKNKLLEIQSLLNEYKPDLCYVTEANLWEGCDPVDMEIPGHWLILPNTLSTLHHARIVLIVRNGITVEKLDNLMDDHLAVIWVKVGQARNKSVISGGIYREFKQYGTNDSDLSRQELLKVQEKRWFQIISKWNSISSRCVVVGDLNIDHLKWSNPEPHVISLVDKFQSTIANKGYCQLVAGPTRFMENQTPSLLDHIWTNCDERTIDHFNST